MFAQEQELYCERRARHVGDITEATSWQRSWVKFARSIDAESGEEQVQDVIAHDRF